MKIIRAGTDSVLIHLERADERLLLDGEGQFSRDRARRLALRALRALRIPCDPSAFSLHVFLGAGEGLLLAGGHPAQTPALFCFPRLDDLAAGASCLTAETEASLYFMEKQFYLHLPSCSVSESAILSEFGESVPHPEESVMLVKERGQVISSGDALSRLHMIG